MMAIGPLMIEHRLIERTIPIMKKECDRISAGAKADSVLIGSLVDFFRIYTDQYHHGKEEHVLFRELSGKKISEGHKKILDELLREHSKGRELVNRLSKAKDGKAVKGYLQELVSLYTRHIETEDKKFFIPAMEYFSSEENENMLKEMDKFDREIDYKRYHTMIEELEKRIA